MLKNCLGVSEEKMHDVLKNITFLWIVSYTFLNYDQDEKYISISFTNFLKIVNFDEKN